LEASCCWKRRLRIAAQANASGSDNEEMKIPLKKWWKKNLDYI
jgi:hypothetical protein